MELARSTSHGGYSLRGILTFVFTVVLAALLWTLFFTPLTHAATDASWNGEAIVYQSHEFTKQTANGTIPAGLPAGTAYYQYIATDSTVGFITFNSSTNPAAATTASYVKYQADSSGPRGSPLAGPTTISLTSKNASASSTRASWSGKDLLFDGRLFEGDGSKPYQADGSTPAGLAQESAYYLNIGSDGIARILYFAPGTDTATATSVTYQEYSASGSGFGAKRGSAKTVSLTPRAQSPEGSGTLEGANGSSCAVDGIGWIVCPVSNFLAWGMDSIFELLKGFLEVEPLSTQTDSPLYQAWNVIRSIANVAFVIAFLIIIYSQITGGGFSNYTIKNLLPRLIIAAVLVNLSYLICAVAVDISNIAGSGVQEILVGLREGLQGPNTNQVSSWASVTSFMLATGTGAIAAGAAIGGVVIASGASLGAALILLLPLLLGLILAALVAFLILAARQALIILLIIVAPLAFVAYLLPNTEKLFEKWRGVFITMLVFFPIFAFVFGGSQLAAFLIIQSASGDNAFNIMLLAMGIQVAPLVITPLLVRFSGGIIGKLAGMVNDPKKGLIDRTRNWAKKESEYMAARNLARQDPVRSRQIFRRFALGYDHLNRSREERLKAYKEASDARWTNSSDYSNIHQQVRYAETSKEEGVEAAELRYERSKHIAGASRDMELRSRNTKLQLETAKAASELQWEQIEHANVAQERLRAQVLKERIARVQGQRETEFKEFKSGRFGTLPVTADVGTMMHQVKYDTNVVALNALRAESAQRAIDEQFTKALKANTDTLNGLSLQTYAGGVQGVVGAQRALASAVQAQSNAYAERIKNATAILSERNFTDDTIVELALGNHASTGITITAEMREAATAKIAGGANAGAIIRLMRNLEINPTEDNKDLRQTFVESILPNSMRPKFFGAFDATQWRQGIAMGPGSDRMHTFVAQAINANKFSADALVSQDKDYLQVVLEAIRDPFARMQMSPSALATLKAQIHVAKTNQLYSGKIGERKTIIDSIESLL